MVSNVSVGDNVIITCLQFSKHIIKIDNCEVAILSFLPIIFKSKFFCFFNVSGRDNHLGDITKMIMIEHVIAVDIVNGILDNLRRLGKIAARQIGIRNARINGANEEIVFLIGLIVGHNASDFITKANNISDTILLSVVIDVLFADVHDDFVSHYCYLQNVVLLTEDVGTG